MKISQLVNALVEADDHEAEVQVAVTVDNDDMLVSINTATLDVDNGVFVLRADDIETDAFSIEADDEDEN